MIQSDKHGCSIQQFGYDFSMFAADWPGMNRHVEKAKMWKLLSDDRVIRDVDCLV